jgi:hypothetical protein
MRPRTVMLGVVGGILVSGLVGCGSTTSHPASPSPVTVATPTPVVPEATVAATSPDTALMTVYRKKRFVGMALHTSVYVDGTEIAELGNGTFVKVKVTPGLHRVWADEESDALAVAFETGKTYFFRMELVPGMWKGNGRMVAVDESTGAQEYADYKPKPTADVKVTTVVVQ